MRAVVEQLWRIWDARPHRIMTLGELVRRTQRGERWVPA